MIYVMSDLHGQFNAYKKMLEKINFHDSDHLYIIGDVIDKGPDGAKLFLDATSRDNVTLMLGNHEYMMYESDKNEETRRTWLRNGAAPTITGFEKENIKLETVQPLIGNLPIIIPDIEIDGRKILLVHAGIPGGINSKERLYMKDMGKSAINKALWTRDLSSRNYAYYSEIMKANYEGYTFLFGHTPVMRCDYCRHDQMGKPKISFFNNGQFINLDCGSAFGWRIGCLRLNDMKEFYVDELETV